MSAKAIGYDEWKQFEKRADRECVTVSMRPVKRQGEFFCRVAIFGNGDLTKWFGSQAYV